METRGIEDSPVPVKAGGFVGVHFIPAAGALKPVKERDRPALRRSCDHPHGSRDTQEKSVAGDTAGQHTLPRRPNREHSVPLRALRETKLQILSAADGSRTLVFASLPGGRF